MSTYAAMTAANVEREDAALALRRAGLTCDVIGARMGVGRARASQLCIRAEKRRELLTRLPKSPDNPKDILIESLVDTTVRFRNCLRDDGIYRLRDLMERSEQQLLRIPNFGRIALAEARAVMARHGLALLGDRLAGDSMMIGDVRVSMRREDGFIGLDRAGEGGWFSLDEFMEVLHQFIGDRM